MREREMPCSLLNSYDETNVEIIRFPNSFLLLLLLLLLLLCNLCIRHDSKQQNNSIHSAIIIMRESESFLLFIYFFIFSFRRPTSVLLASLFISLWLRSAFLHSLSLSLSIYLRSHQKPQQRDFLFIK
jgi:hypothetical protein